MTLHGPERNPICFITPSLAVYGYLSKSGSVESNEWKITRDCVWLLHIFFCKNNNGVLNLFNEIFVHKELSELKQWKDTSHS